MCQKDYKNAADLTSEQRMVVPWVFAVMPDAQDNQGFCMHRIADQVIT